jgi:DNA-binding protein YbaB
LIDWRRRTLAKVPGKHSGEARMADDFEQRIDDARRRLEDLRATRQAPTGEAGAETSTEGVGRAGDDAVEAVAQGGRLRSITIAPHLMRRSDEEMSDLLTAAANEALRRSRAEMLAGAGDTPSLGGLETRVEQLRDQGERAMHEIQTALTNAIAKVGDRTGLSGDPGPQGLDQLLSSLSDTLRAAHAPRDDAAPAQGGRASDDEGHVTASVDGGGTVTGFLFGPRAFRLPSVDLAENAVVAVNVALADVEAGAIRSTVDFSELRSRVAEVREASVRQMTALTASLTGIMSSIREP